MTYLSLMDIKSFFLVKSFGAVLAVVGNPVIGSVVVASMAAPAAAAAAMLPMLMMASPFCSMI
jgi:hypothetical protein